MPPGAADTARTAGTATAAAACADDGPIAERGATDPNVRGAAATAAGPAEAGPARRTSAGPTDADRRSYSRPRSRPGRR